MLRFDQVTKSFGTNTAVNAARFVVDQPMMIGIIRRSGAGKSTLLRMLNRLTDASSSEITFEGLNVTALRGAAKRGWQSQCAMILQQFNLVPPHGCRVQCLARHLEPQVDLVEHVQSIPR